MGDLRKGIASVNRHPAIEARKRRIQAGASSRFHFHWLHNQLSENLVGQIRSDRTDVIISCNLEWLDVFENRGAIRTELSSHPDFAQPPETTKVRVGDLYVREYQTSKHNDSEKPTF
ncbi:hypothetical protein GN330_10385 [Nitratireductor sp. CAU 1489]|uniref:Uncharacterized protein n=1 Tax=Nitratireductor arenosus TaxID=2682096 RepID=A0A844QEB3_9HYPH|nr:hypothetical protein [Nitratireductor arenosus]MVA97652.1 hypothetical protein [Nitratireductor arenosus]